MTTAIPDRPASGRMEPSWKAPPGLHLAWMLGWNDCTVMFRSRMILMFVIVVPLAMVLITGLAFKGLEPQMSRAAQQPSRLPGKTAGKTGFSPPAAHFDSFTQAVTGNGVLFILLNCVMSGGMGLAQEKRRNTLDRLMVSPMSRGSILLGKVLGLYLVGLLQAAVIFGFGVVVGVALGDVLGVVLVTLLFILVGCSLGLMIAALARREENVQLIGGPVAMVMTALGGGLFPYSMSPPWMQKIALLFPTGWAMEAYHQLLWQGKRWESVVGNLVVLAAFAAVFLAVGIRRLRWE